MAPLEGMDLASRLTLPRGWAERIRATSNLSELREVLAVLVQHIGYSNPSYGAVHPSPFGEPDITFFTSYCSEWVDRYVKKKYVGVDPLIDQGMKRNSQFIWPMELNELASPIQRQFLDEAMDFGIRLGTAQPIHDRHGFALFTCTVNGSPRDNEAALKYGRDALMAVGLVAHEHALRMLPTPTQDLYPVFLPVEKECVQWMVYGRSDYEIADKLRISEMEVAQHLLMAQSKMGANSRAQLAVKAVLENMVDPFG